MQLGQTPFLSTVERQKFAKKGFNDVQQYMYAVTIEI